jgi:predicted Zn-dependent peptidase
VALDGTAPRVATAVRLVLDELHRAAADPVAGPELTSARWEAARALAFRFESADQARAALQWLAVHGDPPDALEHLATQLAAVDGAAVQGALAEAAVGREGIVVGGDAAVIEPALRALGLEPEVIRPPEKPATKD